MTAKKYFIGSILGISAVLGTAIYNNYYSSSDPYWKTQNNSSRDIASTEHLVDPVLLNDYFINESYKKYISYELEPRFWTSLDDKYLKKKARLALHDTFTKTFIQLEKEEEHQIASVIKTNLIGSLVDRYVKTLGVFKIFNGAFQFDFNFTPKEHRLLNYNEELSTNQLVNFGEDKKLSELLEEKDYSWAQKVHMSNTPNSGETLQYNGGSISVWFKLLDLNPVKLKVPIPNPKKNAIKGYVRYRKYFRLNEPSKFELVASDKKITSDMLHFKKKSGENHIYLTVDLYQSFNLGNMVPQNDKLVIHFGDIVPNNLNRDSILKSLVNIFNTEKKINTAALTLHGKYKGHFGEKKFRSKIKTLEYSFKEKGFTSKSKIHTTFRPSHPSGDDAHLESRTKFEIKNKILDKFGHNLIDVFQLNRFSSSVGKN